MSGCFACSLASGPPASIALPSARAGAPQHNALFLVWGFLAMPAGCCRWGDWRGGFSAIQYDSPHGGVAVAAPSSLRVSHHPPPCKCKAGPPAPAKGELQRLGVSDDVLQCAQGHVTRASSRLNLEAGLLRSAGFRKGTGEAQSPLDTDAMPCRQPISLLMTSKEK